VQEHALKKGKETQNPHRRVGHRLVVNDLVSQLLISKADVTCPSLLSFLKGFKTHGLRCKWLLYPILTTSLEELQQGLSLRIRRDTPNASSTRKDLNPGNLTQALQSAASLQVKRYKANILDYDQTNRRLNVVDEGSLSGLLIRIKSYWK